MRVFLTELVKLGNFLLVALDVRNLDETAWAIDEDFALGFELGEPVERLVVADMACGDRFDEFRVMTERKLDEREGLVDLFAVAERAREDYDRSFKTAFEHGFERNTVGDAAIQELYDEGVVAEIAEKYGLSEALIRR